MHDTVDIVTAGVGYAELMTTHRSCEQEQDTEVSVLAYVAVCEMGVYQGIYAIRINPISPLLAHTSGTLPRSHIP